MDVEVKKIDTEFIVDIPREVLPLSKLSEVEETIEIPGEPVELRGRGYPVIVRRYVDGVYLLLTHNIGIYAADALLNLGFDPNQSIFIKPIGIDEWFEAWKYHGQYIRRRIPERIVKKLGMDKFDVYPVWIAGTTIPRREIRIIRKRVRDVAVEYNEVIYPAVETGLDQWQWVIPHTVPCYPIISTAFSMNITPIAQIHKLEKKIIIDIVFTHPSKVAGYMVAEKMGYLFRNMAVRNYTATVEVDYPFLCEIRATYLSCCPIIYYHSKQYVTKLKQALETTVYNMLENFFPHDSNKETGKRYPHSRMSYAEHIDTIDWTNSMVRLRDKYRELYRDADGDAKGYMEYTANGDQPDELALGELSEKKLYYCIKYIRVLNESSYKPIYDINRWEYTNSRIEATIQGYQREIMDQGFEMECFIDENGFIWKA